MNEWRKKVEKINSRLDKWMSIFRIISANMWMRKKCYKYKRWIRFICTVPIFWLSVVSCLFESRRCIKHNALALFFRLASLMNYHFHPLFWPLTVLKTWSWIIVWILKSWLKFHMILSFSQNLKLNKQTQFSSHLRCI